MSSSRRSGNSSSHHHHHGHGGHSHHSHHRSRSPRYSDEDEHYQSSSTDYKSLYKECRNDLKRKRREMKDLEDDLQKEKETSKKAIQDTQDLWKIYYQLQQELQQSYERNAKLQAEKAIVDAEIAARKRKEEEEKKTEATNNPEKIKEALFAMQKQKLEMQQKFNDIVLENKKLKEKELTYEPRLRELDSVKSQVVKAQGDLKETNETMVLLRDQLVRVSYTAEEVNKYKRWNSMLIREAEQKGVRLCTLEAEVAETSRNSKASATLSAVRPKLAAVLAEVQQLRLDVASWSGAAVKDTIAKTNGLLRQALSKIDTLAARINSTDLDWLLRVHFELLQLTKKFDGDDDDIAQLSRSLCDLIERKCISIDAATVAVDRPANADDALSLGSINTFNVPASGGALKVEATVVRNETISDDTTLSDQVFIASSAS